jgi:DNA-binding NarL/FixJ family response regulator
VLASRSRRDALTQTREHPIDLAIFSLAEPETERLAAVREMQALRPLLKIVATAEKESTGSLRAADIIGSQALLTAPLNAESVRPRVSELLRSHPVPYETSH